MKNSRTAAKVPAKTAAQMAMTYVAMGPNSWGKGATIPAAVKNCKKHVPGWHVEKGYTIIVFHVQGFEGVTEMGYITAHAPPQKLQTYTVKPRVEAW